jgi:hypothetical protein
VTVSPQAATYASGSSVRLSAQAAPGYCFSSWTGLASGTPNETVLVIQQNYNLRANFMPGAITLMSTNVGILASGATFVMNATATPGCGWSIKPNVDWISVSKTFATSASPTFAYAVRPNTTGVRRTGTITVADKTVTVTQFP